MAKRVLDEESNRKEHPIRPRHIDVDNHFWDAFGHSETEVSARWIVKLCQKRAGWLPFWPRQIEDIYRDAGFQNFRFNRLLDEDRGFVVLGTDGKYRVTHQFICRCFASSPAEDLLPDLQLV